jgi:hypothetical protein
MHRPKHSQCLEILVEHFTCNGLAHGLTTIQVRLEFRRPFDILPIDVRIAGDDPNTFGARQRRIPLTYRFEKRGCRTSARRSWESWALPCFSPRQTQSASSHAARIPSTTGRNSSGARPAVHRLAHTKMLKPRQHRCKLRILR